VAGGFAGASFVSSYIFGRASDIYGRRRVLLAGLMLSGIALILQVVSVYWGGLVFFSLVRVLVGFCAGMFPAALLAYAFDTSSTRMGRFAAFGSGGWFLGSMVVGALGSAYGISFTICAMMLFVSYGFGLALRFRSDTRIAVPLFPKALIRRNMPVYVAMLIRHTGANMIWVTYPLFLAALGAPILWIGIIYSVNALGQVVFMNLSDRYDSALSVAVGLASSALTFFTFLLAGDYWQIIPSQVILAFAWSFLYAGSLRYVMEKNREKATASGLLGGTMSISGIVGPVLGGISATVFDFKGTIAIATVMSAAALAIFLFELRRSGEFYRLRARSRGSA
jgi:MFS family permease